MGQPLSNVTIVGGGTTGWLAALMMATRFNGAISRGELSLVVVESERIPIIGVGESLAPSMPDNLRQMGVRESQFIKETDATFKIAGYFPGWGDDGGAGESSWINPFVGFLTAGWEFERFELGEAPAGEKPDYARTISPCREAIELAKGPRAVQQRDYEQILRYSYHTDAAKFAPFLRGLAEARGVRRIAADVVGAERDERGHVTCLLREEGDPIPVELVIDATGFAGVIHSRAMGVPMRSYSDILMNDRAVVTQLAHAREDEPLQPATRASGLPHGWAFRVPLYSRTGNGYVFSSRFLSDDEAAEEFAAHLGSAASTQNMRVIPMRVGRTERAWEGNCIALGLAAGFVEPLESSAIFSVEASVRSLLHYFPDTDWEPALRERYNQRAADLFEEVADYISLHYRLSKRSDTAYWRAQRSEMKMSDRMEENLRIWRYTMPHRADFGSTHYFDENTYAAALFGKGFYEGGTLQPMREIDRSNWQGLKSDIDRAHRQALGALPDHRALVKAIRERA